MHALIATLVFRATTDVGFRSQIQENLRAALATHVVNEEEGTKVMMALAKVLSACDAESTTQGTVVASTTFEGWFAPLPSNWASLAKA